MDSTSLAALPSGFIYGAATAAYQIEGAVDQDGRGPSIWDTFSHTPGRVKNNDTGDIACDHFNRWQEDLDIATSLGLDAYRFSIAWSRLFPDGNGQLNKPGLAFYDRLIDGCLARNLKVFPTLYHWDLPQTLYDQGGWKCRSTAEAFAEYAATVVHYLGDRIDALTTFNEPWCSAILGHLVGIHAPGEKNLQSAIQVVHGQHLAHGMAVQTVRSLKPELPLGIVLNVMAVRAETQSADDQRAVERHRTFHNALFLDPLFKGQYPAEILDNVGDHLPVNWQDDLTTICQPLDFWGLNYYTPEVVSDASASESNYPCTRRCTAKEPVTDIGWHIDASALSELLQLLYSRYELPPCYITENGAAFNDGPTEGPSGTTVNDLRRIEYLKNHLDVVKSAMTQGIDIRGYFAWSLLDNFEWAEGYSMRFGLVHVDYHTQHRTLKASAHWYRDYIRQSRQNS